MNHKKAQTAANIARCTCGTVALVCSVFSPLASGTLPSIGCCCCSFGAENSSVRPHTDTHGYTEHTDAQTHTCSWCKEAGWHGHGCERSKQISRRRHRGGWFRSCTTGIQHVHISALSAWNTHTHRALPGSALNRWGGLILNESGETVQFKELIHPFVPVSHFIVNISIKYTWINIAVYYYALYFWYIWTNNILFHVHLVDKMPQLFSTYCFCFI